MQTISQREMRNNSADVLRRVATGESFLITNDGVPAAVLSPVHVGHLERLVAEGVLDPSVPALDLNDILAINSALTSDQLAELDRADR